MIIVIQCKDQVGLVAAIAGALADRELNIVSLREHVDRDANRFFIRIQLKDDGPPEGPTNLPRPDLAALLPPDAIITVNPNPVKKIALLVTKEYHCLSDILVRNHFNTLSATVQCVIGNHATLGDICTRFDIPFHHVSHDSTTKEDFEAALLDVLDHYAPDYIVLAKFMRILSPAFIARYPARIVNIHHSFLPAF